MNITITCNVGVASEDDAAMVLQALVLALSRSGKVMGNIEIEYTEAGQRRPSVSEAEYRSLRNARQTESFYER